MLTSKVYLEAKIYGPYFHERDKRFFVNVVMRNKQVTKLAYARFLYQEYLGRLLETWEEVDHIDDNKTNDVISNLQLLSKAEHNNKTHGTLPDKQLESCYWCDREVVLTKKQQITRKMNARKGNTGPFCGRSCIEQYKYASRS